MNAAPFAKPPPIDAATAGALRTVAARIGPRLLALAIAAASPVQAQVIDSPGPFSGVDLAPLLPDHRARIRAAHEDFALVVAGRAPIHAVADTTLPAPADGGTRFFRGDGYRLTVLRSLSTFGTGDARLVGLVYGPVLTFDDDFAPGNSRQFSQLRFYTPAQLRRLLAQP